MHIINFELINAIESADILKFADLLSQEIQINERQKNQILFNVIQLSTLLPYKNKLDLLTVVNSLGCDTTNILNKLKTDFNIAHANGFAVAKEIKETIKILEQKEKQYDEIYTTAE